MISLGGTRLRQLQGVSRIQEGRLINRVLAFVDFPSSSAFWTPSTNPVTKTKAFAARKIGDGS